MEIETLQAMNDEVSRSLMVMVEVTVRLTVFFAIAGFAVYLTSMIWLCSEETKQSARHRMKSAPQPPQADGHDLLAVLAAPDGGLREGSTGSAPRRAAGATTECN